LGKNLNEKKKSISQGRSQRETDPSKKTPIKKEKLFHRHVGRGGTEEKTIFVGKRTCTRKIRINTTSKKTMEGSALDENSSVRKDTFNIL